MTDGAAKRFAASLAEQPDESIAEDLDVLADRITGPPEDVGAPDSWQLVLRDAARRLRGPRRGLRGFRRR
jgi:hypothetical protein